jgi:hypothetical protein
MTLRANFDAEGTHMFTHFFNFFTTNKKAPEPKTYVTIPPYDPRIGPQITKAMWTEEMLTGELTADQLRNVVDPAGFLNARLAKVQRPTKAHWIDSLTGRQSPVNPSHMSTREQAEAMLQRLNRLGLRDGSVIELRPENAFSRIDYVDDDRRHLYIGGLNVGLLRERYAKYPVETANQMTIAELHSAEAA